MIQAGLSALIWIIYLLFRYGLPKRYKLHDTKIKAIIKSLTAITNNLALSKDDPSTLLDKSKKIFDHFFNVSRNKLLHPHVAFRNYVDEFAPDLVVVEDSLFMGILFQKLESDLVFLGERIVEHDLDSTNLVIRYKLTEKETSLPVELLVIQESLVESVPDSDDGTETKSVPGHSSVSKVFRNIFAHTKGFNYIKLAQLLFDRFNNRLHISAKQNGDVIVRGLSTGDTPNGYLTPTELLDSVEHEIRVCKQGGIQRSYVLNGPPGTGKTTFCHELSKRLCGRVLKLDQGSFNYLYSGNMKFLIEALDCDVVIVDDVDRIHLHDLPTFLYMLEAIKTYNKLPTLLATSNNIKALDPAVIRPGRFDDIIEFSLPTTVEREQLVSVMALACNVELTQEQTQKLATETYDMSPAYIKEFIIQLSIDNNLDKLLKKIERRRKYFTAVTVTTTEIDLGLY